MFPVGFMAIALGMFLVDCAIKNRSPIATLEAIVSDPKNLRGILNRTAGTGYQSTYHPTETISGFLQTPIPGTAMQPDGSNPVADEAVAFARAQIGKPYRWGATGPNAYDCSGLVQASYKYAGVKLPRTTYQQILVGHKVKKHNLQIGDLVFPDPGHVQIYSGNGNVIEAPHTGLAVREVKMWGFMTARRVAPNVKVVSGSNTLAGLGSALGTNAAEQQPTPVPGYGGMN